MNRYILGVDIGTTRVKAKIYDLSGNLISQGATEYACVYPRPGWVDQDINMLASSSFKALAATVASSGVDPAQIASIGLSTQRGLHFYVGENEQVLRGGMGLSWQDARHHKQLAQLRSTIGDERFYAITGLPISAFWPIGKVLWMQENEPREYAKTRKIASTEEYFLRQLGARDAWFIDWSNASCSDLWTSIRSTGARNCSRSRVSTAA